ncbi:hypothetical protein PVAP13_9KG040257 [Panicum virgatum]|uniref:Uncharacterized protein n=1 Tax=Panicum virgatum TaxID=38727 RepID=A0A8T0NET8_PANVG|nr:hypothetical protein PVAP13_9KG040257 [Panicum virgatum]
MSPRSNRRKNSVPEFAGPKTTGSPPRRLRSGELGHRLIRNRPPPKNRNGAAGSIKPEAARKKARRLLRSPLSAPSSSISPSRLLRWGAGRRGSQEPGQSDPAQRSRRRGRAAAAAETGLGPGLL